MSDGPHKSLKMRRAWKRLAECADYQVFEADEVAAALVPALEQDCREDMSEEFLSGLSAICRQQEGFLFKDDLRPSLEALRDVAGSGLGRVALDYAIQAAANGATGMDIPQTALTNALKDRAERGKRQVEEHYCRQSTNVRAINVRDRIDQAIARSDINALTRRVLNLEPKKSSARPAKQRGLDDGVKL